MLVVAGLNKKIVFSVGEVTELLLLELDTGREYTLEVSDAQAEQVLQYAQEAAGPPALAAAVAERRTGASEEAAGAEWPSATGDDVQELPAGSAARV